MSQTDLARAIGVSLRTVQLYEKKEANIPIKNLKKIAQYFGLNLAELYAYEVNETAASYNGKVQYSDPGYQFHQVGKAKYLIWVPFVSGEDQITYAENFRDGKFLEGLSRIGFVVEETEEKLYVAFEITNNSMDNGKIEGIPNQAIVLGKKISLKHLDDTLRSNPGRPWILVTAEGVMCKRVSAANEEGGMLRCQSLNPSPEYADFDLDPERVKQLFLVVKKLVD